MQIYVFGNKDVDGDKTAFEVAEKLGGLFPEISFVEIKPNADLPFENEQKVIILDTVAGIIEEVVLLENDLDKLVSNSLVSVHDFDLGFQLKLMLKLGKLKRITIVGIPQGKEPDYERIQSILRKLVEQDIQGS